MRIRSVTSLVMLAALVAALTVLSLGQSPAAYAGSLSFVPSEDDLMFRRYRGDDEVSDRDDNHGRGRGRGRGGRDAESGNSGGHSSHGNGGSSDSSGTSGNSKSGGSDRDDVDDRFGK